MTTTRRNSLDDDRGDPAARRARHGPAALVSLLAILDPDHPAAQSGGDPSADFASAVNRFAVPLVELRVAGSTLLVCGERLRVGGDVAAAVADVLRRHGIAALHFDAPVPAADVAGFAQAWTALDSRAEVSAEALHAQLVASGIRSVRALAASDGDDSPRTSGALPRRGKALGPHASGQGHGRRDRGGDGRGGDGRGMPAGGKSAEPGPTLEHSRGGARRGRGGEPTRLIPSLAAYMRTVSVLREARARVQHRQPMPIKHGKRAVQAVAELLERDEAAVLALASARVVDDGALSNAINTAILAMSMARRLELPPKLVGELGLAALFLHIHDGGAAAAAALLRSPAAGDAVARCLRIALEHERSRSGALAGRGRRSLSSDIIAVCAAYTDILTRERVGQVLVTPAIALGVLLRRAGDRFDPALVKLLVLTLGAYPPGTLVQLDTGETAAVVRSNPNAEQLDRPVVRLLTTPQGEPADGLVDLTAPGDGREYARSIECALTPTEVGLGLTEHLAVL